MEYDTIGYFSIIIIIIAIALLMIVSVWMIYVKADKPGWASIIPIYSTIVLLQIVGKPWWWIFLLFIPIINVIILVLVTYLLSKSFGKGIGFAIGLLLLGIIFYPILGLGSATYKKLESKN